MRTDADRLSKDAQHALRRTMEKHMSKCRVVLCTNSISKMIPAIRSRCLGIRVPAPSSEDMKIVLNATCRKEGLTLPDELADRIVAISGRNMRRALLICETCKVQQYPFTGNQPVEEPDWEMFVDVRTEKTSQKDGVSKSKHKIRGFQYQSSSKFGGGQVLHTYVVQTKLARFQWFITLGTVSNKVHDGTESVIYCVGEGDGAGD
eukprot:sb/3470478/